MVKFVVIFGFIVSFAAGLMVGMVSHSSPAEAGQPVSVSQPSASTHPFGGGRGVLPAALNLTPDQQEKMKKIWGDHPQHDANAVDPRRQARDERDGALQALLTSEQKAKYDQIQKDFQDRISALDRDFRDDFQKKVQETVAILTPEQSVKYQEFVNRHQSFDRGPRDRGDRGFREQNRRGDDRATSQPRSQNQ